MLMNRISIKNFATPGRPWRQPATAGRCLRLGLGLYQTGAPGPEAGCVWIQSDGGHHPYTWLFNIAMENGPFIDDFPIKTSIYWGFSTAM